MFGKAKAMLLAFVLAVVAMVSTSPVMAQIDVTDATDSITSAVTGGVLVLGALIVAFGTFLGYHIIKSLIKRG